MSRAKRQILPVFIPNLGCAHECVFCDQRLISGESDPISADDVRNICNEWMKTANGGTGSGGKNSTFETSEKILKTAGKPPAEEGKASAPAEVAFYGGSFTALPANFQNELLEAVQPILKLNSQNSIRVSTRPDCIDRQTVDRLKSFGVGTIEIGAQSMCDEVLALAKRGHTAGDTVKASGIIKDAGLALILQMMTGLQGDSYDRSLYTARCIIDLKPDGVRVYPTVVIRGTRLFNMWQTGQYREHSVEDAVGLCAEISALFSEAGVPVIRMGLNPSNSLSSGDAVAGAYHPAFGELVYSRVYYNKAVSGLIGVEPDSNIVITVAYGHTSKMSGNRRDNVRRLIEKHSLRSLKIVESDIVSGEIKIEITP